MYDYVILMFIKMLFIYLKTLSEAPTDYKGVNHGPLEIDMLKTSHEVVRLPRFLQSSFCLTYKH